MKKYTQLTREQRYPIYLLNKQGYNQTFIAKSMDRNKSTISRELSRNTILFKTSKLPLVSKSLSDCWV
jgi:IS30 family transposase